MKAKMLRNGMVVVHQGKILQVISFKNKGDTIESVSLNLRTDQRETVSFHHEDELKQVLIEYKELQYSYQDNETYMFMDIETFNLECVSKQILGAKFHYVKESDMCKGAYVENELIRIYPPRFVRYKIISTASALSKATKSAKLENGMIVQVPDYYSAGDIAVIDTASDLVVGRE